MCLFIHLLIRKVIENVRYLKIKRNIIKINFLGNNPQEKIKKLERMTKFNAFHHVYFDQSM